MLMRRVQVRPWLSKHMARSTSRQRLISPVRHHGHHSDVTLYTSFVVTQVARIAIQIHSERNINYLRY